MFKDPDAKSAEEEKNPDAAKSVFEGIYQRFRIPIMKYVSRTVKDDGVAEELTQEIFIKAFRFKDSYQSRFRVSTWLWSIARNTVLDWKRKNQNSPPLVYAHSHELPYDIEQAADTGQCIERSLAEREERETLLALTHSLTEMQRKVLFMRVIDQLTYIEISRRLNLTLSAVKCLFFRAKATLTSGINGTTQESLGPGLPGLKVELPAFSSESEHSDTPHQAE